MLSQPVDPSSISTHVAPLPKNIKEPPDADSATPVPPIAKKPKKKRRGKAKTNKWADRCMYAELLEMASDPSERWLQGSSGDGLPVDLETGWVALSPVPQGKRCIAITQTAVGVPSHATLRSRLLGKILIPRFPAVLPPHCVLDCILDSHWKENGVLHVLDILKWKGQDLTECESAFRFWWRDTRIAELPPSTPPPVPSDSNTSPTTEYTFPYPITFLPVPYHTDTTLSNLLTHITPSLRVSRSIPISLPLPLLGPETANSGGMEVDFNASKFNFGPTTQPQLRTYGTTATDIVPDGLLLYVKAASYDSGTSPLSSWVPLESYDGPEVESPVDVFERSVEFRSSDVVKDAD
ncbi:hypothetical protein H0H92_002740 [Tricholoma furcatifolium]|nr:hypothetical protein H0H92_002740 [Tricholoma furcatifolium]